MPLKFIWKHEHHEASRRSVTLVSIAILASLPWQTAAAASESWSALNHQGNLLREQGNCRQEIPLLVRARAAAIAEMGALDAAVSLPVNNLGAAYQCLGEFTRAEKHFREALALLDAGPSALMRFAIQNNLAVLLLSTSRKAEAEQILQAALNENIAAPEVHPRHRGVALTILGVLRLSASRYVEAGALFRRALDIYETLPDQEADLAAILNNLGVVHLYLREYEDARIVTRRSVALRRRLLPPPPSAGTSGSSAESL